eukprot:361797-Chlamydomonas_euryale.AAC.6
MGWAMGPGQGRRCTLQTHCRTQQARLDSQATCFGSRAASVDSPVACLGIQGAAGLASATPAGTPRSRRCRARLLALLLRWQWHERHAAIGARVVQLHPFIDAAAVEDVAARKLPQHLVALILAETHRALRQLILPGSRNPRRCRRRIRCRRHIRCRCRRRVCCTARLCAIRRVVPFVARGTTVAGDAPVWPAAALAAVFPAVECADARARRRVVRRVALLLLLRVLRERVGVEHKGGEGVHNVGWHARVGTPHGVATFVEPQRSNLFGRQPPHGTPQHQQPEAHEHDERDDKAGDRTNERHLEAARAARRLGRAEEGCAAQQKGQEIAT